MDDFGALRALLHAEDVDWDAVWGMVRRWPDAVELAEVVVPYMRGHLPRVPAEAHARWEIPAAWMRRLAAGEVLPAAALCQSASVWWDDLPWLASAGVVLPQLRRLSVFEGAFPNARCNVRDIWTIAPALEVLGLYGGNFNSADRVRLEAPGAPETLRELTVYADSAVGYANDGLCGAAWTGSLEVLDLAFNEDARALVDDRMLERLSEGGRLRELSLWGGVRSQAQLERLVAWEAPQTLRSVRLSAWFDGYEGFTRQLMRARWWPQIERAELELQHMAPEEAHTLLRLGGESGAPWRELWLYGIDEPLIEVLMHERLRSVERLTLYGATLPSLWRALADDTAPRALTSLCIGSVAHTPTTSLEALPFAAQLRELDLSGCPLDRPRAISSALRGMRALETLNLSRCGLTDACVEALPLDELPALRALHLELSAISSATLAGLLDHADLSALRVLCAHHWYPSNHLSDVSLIWRALAEGRLVEQLTHLSVNVLGASEAELLDEALGRLAGGMRTLTLGVAQLDLELCEALARTPFAQLDHLTLDVQHYKDNKLTSSALNALSEASWMEDLTQLTLRGPRMDWRARAPDLSRLRALRVRLS